MKTLSNRLVKLINLFIDDIIVSSNPSIQETQQAITADMEKMAKIYMLPERKDDFTTHEVAVPLSAIRKYCGVQK